MKIDKDTFIDWAIVVIPLVVFAMFWAVIVFTDILY